MPLFLQVTQNVMLFALPRATLYANLSAQGLSLFDVLKEVTQPSRARTIRNDARTSRTHARTHITHART